MFCLHLQQVHLQNKTCCHQCMDVESAIIQPTQSDPAFLRWMSMVKTTQSLVVSDGWASRQVLQKHGTLLVAVFHLTNATTHPKKERQNLHMPAYAPLCPHRPWALKCFWPSSRASLAFSIDWHVTALQDDWAICSGFIPGGKDCYSSSSGIVRSQNNITRETKRRSFLPLFAHDGSAMI